LWVLIKNIQINFYLLREPTTPLLFDSEQNAMVEEGYEFAKFKSPVSFVIFHIRSPFKVKQTMEYPLYFQLEKLLLNVK
jgi:hypothetical protein